MPNNQPNSTSNTSTNQQGSAPQAVNGDASHGNGRVQNSTPNNTSQDSQAVAPVSSLQLPDSGQNIDLTPFYSDHEQKNGSKD